MGDRANIGFRNNSKTSDCIWVYTHWMGEELPELATLAVKVAEPRWDDPSYATRIALTAIIGPIQGETGFGVDGSPGDNEHDGFVIDWENQKVLVIARDVVESWYKMNPVERLNALNEAVGVTFKDVLAEGKPAPDCLTKVWDSSAFVRESPGQGLPGEDTTRVHLNLTFDVRDADLLRKRAQQEMKRSGIEFDPEDLAKGLVEVLLHSNHQVRAYDQYGVELINEDLAQYKI